jgi:hypothetical protein
MTSGRIILHKSDKLQHGDETTIKCFACFSRQVKRVCHHCGAYLCKECEPWPVKWLRKGRLYNLLFKDREFFGLYEFKPEFELSAHCKKHIHYEETLYNLLIWFIIVIGLVGVLLGWLWNSREVAVGLGVMALAALLGLLPTRALVYRSLFSDPKHLFLILPTVYKVEIAEAVTANFRVDNDTKQYLDIDTAIEKTSGSLTVSLSSLPSNYWRQKQVIGINAADTIHFFAGYLGLDGLKKVKFYPTGTTIKFKDTTVPHGGEKVNHQGKLSLAGNLPVSKFEQLYREQNAIVIEQSYEILEKAGWVGPECDRDFPFWIVGDLSLAGQQLNILIYVTPEIDKKLKLERLSVTLPDEIVKEGVEINGLLNTRANNIFWTSPVLQVGINIFFLKFRKALPVNAAICGEYKISIEDFLLSGLKMEKEGQLWFANGEPVPKPESNEMEDDWLDSLTKKTTFSGTFQLNTSVFKVPREYTDSNEGEQRHRRPDHNLISKIAQILTDQNVEIKSIIETPARIGDIREGARLWDHYWEIKSRYYLEAELQYVEVHMVIYGQENWAILFKPELERELAASEETPVQMPTSLTKPGDEYKFEFTKWQLHLRSEISVNNCNLIGRLQDLRIRLEEKIREAVAESALPIE